jgi:predicted ATP-grasp superfamily ATP-dependent carboligase
MAQGSSRAPRAAALHRRTSFSVRTDRHDGSGQTIEGITVEAVPLLSGELARVVEAMEYTGIGCAQFLYDKAAGTCCFLEINPRFGASYAFVEWSGFELTRLAIELACPNVPSQPDPRPTRPTRFVWTHGDVAGLVFSLRQGDIGFGKAIGWTGNALLAALRANVQIGWSWDDPKPLLRFYSRRLRTRSRHGAAPATGSALPSQRSSVREADRARST